MAGGWQSEGGIEELDAELARLGRGAAGLRLRLGELLELILRTGAHHELGFSSIDAYALERCERSARWSNESRAVARRLRRLPRMRRALLRGELGWSMVELLSRHARPENERTLLERGRGATVRAMKLELVREPAEDDEPYRTIALTVPRVDAWALEFTRLLLRAATDVRSTNELVEAMLAEGLTALQRLAPEAAHAELDPGGEAASLLQARVEQLRAWRLEAEQACERRVERRVEPLPPIEETVEDLAPHALDGRARQLARELAARDLVIGELFERLRGQDGWRRLGWASAGQYARERVGISHASLKSRVTLSRRVAAMPQVAEALRAGKIGYEAATLVARVARPDTVAAWLARAEERTIKHLREDVDAVEMVARTTGDASVLLPPDDDTMEAYFAVERFVLSGAASRSANGQMSEGDAGGGTRDVTGELESQMSGGRLPRGTGHVRLRFRVREELFLFWRELEERFRRSGIASSFLGFLCVASWQSWAHPFDGQRAYAEIYERDCYRCSSPVCPSRQVGPHHLVYRSHGGGDEPENVGSLCLWCHLIGEHQGKLKVEPPASRMTWTLGRDPIMIVRHRQRILIDGGTAA